MINDHSLPIILYDNHCELCRRSVHFIRKHGGNDQFDFVALQSEQGKSLLRNIGYPDDYLGSVLLADTGSVYKKSDAVLKILSKLNSPWKWIAALKIIPRPVRDLFYRIISWLRNMPWVQRAMKCKECGYN